MQVKDLLDLISNYNSEKSELFNRSADLLLSGVRNELEDIYHRGGWAEMVDVTQIGVSIRKISQDFQKFTIDILGGYLLRFGKTLKEDYNMLTLPEFIENAKEIGVQELSGFGGEDIRLLLPLYKALKEKGVECYADPDNGQLVAAIDVK